MKTSTLLRKIMSYLPIFAVIFTAVVMRVIPHPPNFAPIAALALFSGAYLSKRLSFLIPMAAMFVSDIIIGFHSTMPYVYGSFVLISLIGILIKRKITAVNLLGSSLVASILFFLITNFGAWLTSTMYSKTLQGLMEAYIMGIPFFRNTVAGDLVFTFSFFYGYVVLEKIVETGNWKLASRNSRIPETN